MRTLVQKWLRLTKAAFRLVLASFHLSEEDQEITRTVISRENVRRVQYMAVIAIPTSALYFVIFMLKAGSETGVAQTWRHAISICHAVILVSFAIISGLIYLFSLKPGGRERIAAFSVNMSIVILLLEGAALAAADQLVTANITPYLITCLITGLVLLIPPLKATIFFIASFVVFYFAISFTQKNSEILVSNQINGLTAAALGICLSVILWRGYLIRARQSRLISRQNSELKAAFEVVHSQMRDIEQLGRIGRDITSSLSIEKIIQTIYENVNALMDASVFTIGLYKEDDELLEFPAAIESGRLLPPFAVLTSDESHLAARCFSQRQEVIINDCEAHRREFTGLMMTTLAGTAPASLLYLPLWHKDKVIGVISAQSFKANAYTDYHVNVLRNLAAYSAIALENAASYRQVVSLLDELKAAQDKLMVQSKLAALGALTAGIAHEIKNPLNFINNFAELMVELVAELRQELVAAKSTLPEAACADIEDILATLQQNAGKIREHGKRADSIVRSMLQHSRGKSGERQLADINAMLAEDVNLTYHGMRAQDSSFNIRIQTDLDPAVGKLEIVPQDISRVFLNIIANGCYEANRKRATAGDGFMPQITISSRRLLQGVEVRIRDNGSGVPEEIRDKLFLPFFTTKPTGQGTGLGLSISYDIVVQEHKGTLTFESVAGEYTEFIITLPE